MNDLEQTKKPKRKKWGLLVLLFFIFLVAALVVYGAVMMGYIQKIFPGTKISADQAENLINPGQLKGETTGNINVFFLGMRGEDQSHPYLTNGMMILNYNVKTNKINLISLPRDLWITTDKYGDRKISSICDTPVFKTNPLSCFLTGQYVAKNTLGVDINYSFLSDFKGFTEITDQMGTIDVDVTGHKDEWKFLDEPDFVGAQDKNNPSIYHLNGKQALIYVRWPESALPDFNRLERQQQYIEAFEEKFFSPSFLFSPTKLTNTLQSASTNIKTDLQLWEAKKLSDYLAGVNPKDINKYSLTSIPQTDGGLLKVTHFAESETLSPIAGDHDFSQIINWVKNITR